MLSSLTKLEHRDERRDIPTVPSPDVLLVVTTDVEFHAVVAAAKPLTGRDYEEHHGNIRTYYDLGSITGAHVFVVETEMGSMRPGGSLSTVAAAIQELRLGSASGRRPASVIAVGIAFGINERKQAIGQVLVSNHLRTYDPERVSAGEVIPRGDRVPASTVLIGRIRAASKRMTNLKVERSATADRGGQRRCAGVRGAEGRRVPAQRSLIPVATTSHIEWERRLALLPR